jgi:hypothetical protein
VRDSVYLEAHRRAHLVRRLQVLARAQLAANGSRRRGEAAMRRWRPHRRRFS